MSIALPTGVRADRVQEYEAAHREVPEGLTAAIRPAGATSWTVRLPDATHRYSPDGSGAGLPVRPGAVT